MSGSVAAFFDQWHADVDKLKSQAPNVARGFGGLFQAVMQDGALSKREKELIAFGVGLALRCEPCMFLHVEKCLQAGATREQVLEAAGVVVMMQGGPAYTHIPTIIHALDHLSSR